MTDAAAAPIVPAFNADTIEQALKDAQGDLLIASQLLGHVTMMRLDRAIRADPRLQAVFLTIKEVKSSPEYEKASQERLELEVQRRMTFYRADGLEALHELAVMQITDNSAMAQVKLSAAARLAGGAVEKEGASDLAKTLAELNDAFHRHAPRIKVTRETIEIGPNEKVIEAQPSD